MGGLPSPTKRDNLDHGTFQDIESSSSLSQFSLNKGLIGRKGRSTWKFLGEIVFFFKRTELLPEQFFPIAGSSKPKVRKPLSWVFPPNLAVC